MYNLIHSFQDKRFDIYDQHKYKLIISCSEDSIRFICLDYANYCICAETYYLSISPSPTDTSPLQIQNFFNTHPFLGQQKWRQVICIIANKWYTLVPTVLYEKACISDYFKLAVDFVREDLKLFDYSIDQETTVVFAIPTAIIHFLNTIYPSNKLCISYQTNAIITSAQSYLEDSKRVAEPQVLVVTEGSYMYISIIQRSKILYYNRFQYHTGNDWLEYILTVIHTLTLEAAKTQLFLAGDMTKKTLIYKTLTSYIGAVAFVQPPAALKMRFFSAKDFLVHYFPLLNFGLYGGSTGS